eukprot:443659_1
MTDSFLAFSMSMLLYHIVHGQNVANTCEYHCPHEDESPWNKKGHLFSSNGCGSMGIRVNLDSRIEHCCDTHDACYSVCGISRDYCDMQFNKCIKKGCGKDHECASSADMITMGTALFGCEPFLKTQRESCDCLKGHQFNERVTNTLKEMYSKLTDKHKKTDDELQEIQDKYKGKEDKLVNNILKKYPKELIVMEDMSAGNKKRKPTNRRKRRQKYKPDL